MKNDALIITELRGGIAWVTINRPDKLNALSAAVVTELREKVTELEANDEVRVIFLRGAASDVWDKFPTRASSIAFSVFALT